MRYAVAAASNRKERLDAIIDSAITQLKKPEAELWQIMGVLASHNDKIAVLKKYTNDSYVQAVTEEIESISPQLTPERMLHIAQLINIIIDGISVQFSHRSADGQELDVIAQDIKATLFTILESTD